MPVINSTPSKQLSSCDASEGAVFNTSRSGCDYFFINTSPLSGVTNIEYEISLGATVVDTVNTTNTIYEWEPASLFSNETLSIKQTITATLGTFDVTIPVTMPDMTACRLAVNSNLGAGDTFDPLLTSSPAKNTYWRTPDNLVTGPVTSLGGLGSGFGFDGTTQTFYVTNGDQSAVDRFDVVNDSVLGFVDFRDASGITDIDFISNSGFTSLNVDGLANLELLQLASCGFTGSFSIDGLGLTSLQSLFLQNNSGLTGLIIDDSITTYEVLRADNCDIGTLDFSNCVFNSVRLQFPNNTNLASVDFTGASGSLEIVEFRNSDITSLDLSPFTLVDDVQVRLETCTLLTSLNMSGVTGYAYRFWVNNTGLSGSLDLSGLVPNNQAGTIGGDIRVNNTSISDVLFKTTGVGEIDNFNFSSSSCTVIDYYSNEISASATVDGGTNTLTAAEVNENLVNLDNAAAVATGATGTINIGGAGPAAPDGSSGGFDGLTAVANLVSYGYTVNTN